MGTTEGRSSANSRFTIIIASLIVIASLVSCASNQTVRNDTPPSPGGNNPGGAGQSPGGMPPSEGGGQGGSKGSENQGMPGGPGGHPQQTVPLLEKQNYSRYFTDLNEETANYNAYIDYLVEQGFIEKGTGLYRPYDTLTRSEFAAMLYAHYRYTGAGSSYEDVQVGASYYQAVMRGKAAKIFADTKYFSPTRALTRETAALWMYRSELLRGMPKEMSNTDLSAYKDAASIAKDARLAVATMTHLGVLTAATPDSFKPSGTFTRAEIALVLYRLSFLGNGSGGHGSGGNN